jgi:menaquinone-dependent protoporphyrinogen oxidase
MTKNEILLIYESNHGSTTKIANKIKSELNKSKVKTDLINIKETKKIDLNILNKYDKIILGSPIYAGSILKNLNKFINKNYDLLKNKKLFLFLSGLAQGKDAELELKNQTPKLLNKRIIYKEFINGEIIFQKLNFFEKIIMKIITKSDKDILKIDDKKISSFASEILKK